jgi:hypothetical protein
MHEARSAVIACSLAYASVSFLAACNAFDPSVLERLSPIENPRDAGGRDAGQEQPCTVGFETCNGEDDDCDDEVDENADVACVQPNAEAMCAAGRCVRVSCDDGWADCNSSDADGCEHDEENGPCSSCTGIDCEPEMDAGRDPEPDAETPEDAAVDAELDAEVDEGNDACVAMAETCDDEDNDCDGRTDEGSACDVERCIETTPSYRGAACDRCACEKCAGLVNSCQRNPDSTWQGLCRDVIECYVVETRAGNCPDGDCYGIGGGPCVEEIDSAAGGGNVAANCTPTSPPTTACMAAGNYRDQCTESVCADECAD